jgi:hypothetical protein
MTLAVSGWLFQAGCIQQLQQELEVLFRLEASPNLIRDSFVVDWFGPSLLQLFN